MTKYCPACGEKLIDEARFCKNCGIELENNQGNINAHHENTQQFKRANEKSHTLAIVAGYVLAILIPLFGLIISIYLLTRDDSPNAKKHGKYVLIVAVVVWFLSFLSMLH